jgi:hypothetical protein
LLTFILGASAPTGSHRYGAGAAMLSPTLAFGKGSGRFDVQSTFGANLRGNGRIGQATPLEHRLPIPSGAEPLAGTRSELHLFRNGEICGTEQIFLTPGLGFGRVRLGGRFRFSFAVGMQIAPDSTPTIIAGCSRNDFRSERMARGCATLLLRIWGQCERSSA